MNLECGGYFKNENFQLYFAGGWNTDVDLYLQEHNLNRLGSQLNERSLFNEWFKAKNEGKGGHLFVDSGAWTAHSQGVELDIDEYIGYINEYDDYFYIYAEADTIPGKFRQEKTYEERMAAPKISWDNYLYMVDKVASPFKLVPVFHMGEDFKWLKNMLEFKDSKGNHIPYIGLSPANDSFVTAKVEFFKQCFNVIQDSSNPRVRTHAFGMTSLDVLERFPFTSADSTTWLVIAANGGILTPYGIITISAKSGVKGHYLDLDKDTQKKIDKYIHKQGFAVEEAMHDYKVRMKLNINYLMDFMENYKYTPCGTSNGLFDL